MMKESVAVALTWVRAHADRFPGVAARFDDATDVHVHADDAGQSKGRSARGGHLRRRPHLRARRAAGAGRRGHDRRVDADGDSRARRRHSREGARGVPRTDGSGDPAAANEADATDIFGDGLPCDISIHYAKMMDDVLKVTLPGVLAQPAAGSAGIRGRHGVHGRAPDRPAMPLDGGPLAERGKIPLLCEHVRRQPADRHRGRREDLAGWRADPDGPREFTRKPNGTVRFGAEFDKHRHACAVTGNRDDRQQPSCGVAGSRSIAADSGYRLGPGCPRSGCCVPLGDLPRW